jgi:putative SOS response-associated peptidase YedK
MCGRFGRFAPAETLAEQFDIAVPDSLEARYNIAPRQDVLVVCPDGRGGREGRFLNWGLVPFWADDPKIGDKMINARAESVFDKPAFKASARRRRCLAPADGFFEWMSRKSGKQPFFIRMKNGDRLMALAGIWDRWESDDRIVESFSILTTEANELVAPIHDRMPVVVDENDYGYWLDPDAETERLKQMLGPFPSDRMEAYPVSTKVNNPQNDTPDCVQPQEDDQANMWPQ